LVEPQQDPHIKEESQQQSLPSGEQHTLEVEVQSQPTPLCVRTDSQHSPVKAPSHLLHTNANPHQSTAQADKAQQSIGDRPPSNNKCTLEPATTSIKPVANKYKEKDQPLAQEV
jgi:hypothetical protein